MASATLSTAACPSQLCSSKNGIYAPSHALLFKPTKFLSLGKDRRMKIACQATSISADRVPDMGKRKLMNLLLLGALSLPTGAMLFPYTYFFGDPTYLVVEADRSLATYGINAVCTHLGCVVPWNSAENKFICPCHGSQYNYQGKVVRGPAPLSLALAHADIDEGKVLFVPWVETDFRTGEDPWWS
ncbi:hypothetical protein KFK09_002897 [Dendrobium nobile]|uniref:plastoquinol--plastocyanin reductase n=1 Tax=Dendrobium nobile TaxID=94219 RepID=A0A8T3C4Y5_DENNO|nr:hypothetical protein KFK09_002897 [Dendrobium nobile]